MLGSCHPNHCKHRPFSTGPLRFSAAQPAAAPRHRLSSTQHVSTEPRHVSSSTEKGSAGSSLARDVRAVPIRIITVSKGNSQAANAMAAEWVEKLKRYTKVEEIQIKPNPKRAASTAVAVASEAEKVLKAVGSSDYVVALDERGREVRSEDIAKLIAAAGDRSGATNLTFCIGGPFGHGEAVRSRADDTIRLSALVLNHQVAHVLLVEQLYRGWTILRGEPYHH